MRKALFFWLTVFLITTLNSCGTRKTELHKKEAIEKTGFSGFFRNSGNSEEFLNTNLNIQTEFISSLLKIEEIDNDEFTIESKDSSKPAVYIDPFGKKYFLENAKLTNKKTAQKLNTKLDQAKNSSERLNTNAEKKYDSQTENQTNINSEGTFNEVDRSSHRYGWSKWNLFWLILSIALIYALRKLYKFYKKKNPL
ncbi:hypothetical protein [Flavobacterium panacagri]|uniref:hypothetical protein n=1 Tax=Flavobacterium panacagri TaxID=3034146 RepID=UPI0025A54260|nr:hypothetical protein [Flavobacterium panacagri]